MDKETKNFFEKLSGISKNGEESGEEIGSDADELEITTGDAGLGLDDDTEGQLTVDVYETPSSFIIKSAVAGVDGEKLDISITSDAVAIKGERSSEEKVKAENYLHQECYWGKFSRSIILPQEIDPDKAQASLKNGILKINLPKVSKAKSKKLKVKFE